MWHQFLSEFNGISVMQGKEWLSTYSLKFHTDSAGGSVLVCGVYFDGHWCHLSWPDQWSRSDLLRDITFLELIPIALAVACGRKVLRQSLEAVLIVCWQIHDLVVYPCESRRYKNSRIWVIKFMLHVFLLLFFVKRLQYDVWTFSWKVVFQTLNKEQLTRVVQWVMLKRWV